MRHAGLVYGHSKGKAPGSKQYLYRPTLRSSLWDSFLLEKSSIGTLCQVCCGGSGLGIARVDWDPEAPGLNIIADMFSLPFADQSFDTVACDPIYGIPYPRRINLQRECARIARKRIVFKAPWVPRATGFKLIEAILILSHTCANVAVLSVLDREEPQA